MTFISNYTTKVSKLADTQRLAFVSLAVFSVILPVLLMLAMQKVNLVAYAGGPVPTTPPISTPTQNYITQTFNWGPGFNTLGITVNKTWYGVASKIKSLGGGTGTVQYRASDLLWDLNNSFVTLPPTPFVPMGGGYDYPISVIYRYNADRGIWEYYTPQGYGNNFSVIPGEGYFVKTSMRGASAINGLQIASNISILIPRSWSMVSLPGNTRFANADSLLQGMRNQGIDVYEMVRWINSNYVIHQVGSPEDNFPIVPGEGYWVYNNGDAKTFVSATADSYSPSLQNKLSVPNVDVKKIPMPPATLPKTGK